jgi:quercetin dioxygenase-like cupin family protein
MQLEVVPWKRTERPNEVALRHQLEAEGFAVFRWHDDAGANYTPHSHDHDESLWVIEGEMLFGAGGREFRLGPGDRLMLPQGMVHTARAGPAGVTYLIGEAA